MITTLSLLLGLGLSFSCLAGDAREPHDAEACKNAIAQAARAVHLVGGTTAACKPIDPACAALQEAAGGIDKIQRQALDRASNLAQSRCAAYEEQVRKSSDKEVSWRTVMDNCSPSIEKIPPSFFPCIAKPVKAVQPPLQLPPRLIPQAESTETKMK